MMFDKLIPVETYDLPLKRGALEVQELAEKGSAQKAARSPSFQRGELAGNEKQSPQKHDYLGTGMVLSSSSTTIFELRPAK